MVLGEINVKNSFEAAFVRFCLLQRLYDSQIVVLYDDRPPRYSVGVVILDKDLPYVRKVLKTLDEFKIYYETNLDLPTA